MIFATIVFGIGFVLVHVDDYLECKFINITKFRFFETKLFNVEQITFQRTNNKIVVDFRVLATEWDVICLVSRHTPDPGVSTLNYYPKKERQFLSELRNRLNLVKAKGCWKGSDPKYLTLALWNIGDKTYGEYRINILKRARMVGFKTAIQTNYTYLRPALTSDEFQCTYVTQALAKCSKRSKQKKMCTSLCPKGIM